jgi:hypothetical protein
MPDRGFESDAAYSDIVAKQSKDPIDRRQLRQVARKYRSLSKNGGALLVRSRREDWQHRADQCRAPAIEFSNLACRAQLQRLADTYEMMVANGDLQQA